MFKKTTQKTSYSVIAHWSLVSISHTEDIYVNNKFRHFMLTFFLIVWQFYFPRVFNVYLRIILEYLDNFKLTLCYLFLRSMYFLNIWNKSTIKLFIHKNQHIIINCHFIDKIWFLSQIYYQIINLSFSSTCL